MNKIKRGICFITVISILVFIMSGCSDAEYNKQTITNQEQQISKLNSEIKELKNQKTSLQNSVVKIKEKNGTANYIVTLKIKQSHVFWQVSDNIKDEMNTIKIQIPVSKKYYDTVKVGTVINDDFRMGSLVLGSSIGKWNISIAKKEIK